MGTLQKNAMEKRLLEDTHLVIILHLANISGVTTIK